MIIKTHGVVIIGEGPIKVEGWNVQREDGDPKDATDEQLLMDVVIKWARDRFNTACNRAVLAATKKQQQVSLPTMELAQLPPRCPTHDEQMVITFFARPGGPPGNNWMCRSCAKEREAN